MNGKRDCKNCIHKVPVFDEEEGIWRGAECDSWEYNFVSRAEAMKAYEARPQGEWIPVSERLPQNYILCLFCDIDGDIYYGHHTSENRWYAEYLDDKIKNVIAWQPLPDPYKKGGAE